MQILAEITMCLEQYFIFQINLLCIKNTKDYLIYVTFNNSESELHSRSLINIFFLITSFHH